MKGEKSKKKSFLGKNIEEFASRSSVHGLSYVFDRQFKFADQFLWLVIFVSFLAMAIYLITIAFNDWQDNQVITPIKVLAKPIASLKPAITICAPGLHFGQVEKVLYTNFKNWVERNTFENTAADAAYAKYMDEEFQIEEKGVNIMDILNTMILPEASEANAVRQHQLSCVKKEKTISRPEENGSRKG